MAQRSADARGPEKAGLDAMKKNTFNKNKRAWAAAAIITACLVPALFWLFLRTGTTTPQFRTEQVSRGGVTAAVTATGTVNAVTAVQVGTQVSGTIREIYVDFNSLVKKGQLIAQLDPEMFQAQVEQARANVLKAEAQARDAERALGRNRELFARDMVARSDVDTAETNHDGAQAQLAQANAAHRVAETNLRYTRVLSPVDGIVISRNVDVGQTVAASFQTPTLFTIARDLTRMQINTNVAEADIGAIKNGQDVEFTVDAYPESVFHGSVRQIRRAPITVQNVVTYDVVVQCANSDLRLMPGMTANVSIVLSRKQDVLRIPNRALRYRPEKTMERPGPPAKGPTVWVIEKNGEKAVPVTLGVSDGTYTELVGGELTENQELIVENLARKQARPGRGPRMF